MPKTQTSRPRLAARAAAAFVLLAATCVVLAGCGALRPRPAEFIVGTYNIHIGKDLDNRLDLPRIADVIVRSGAEVVGIQEVDRFTTRVDKIDEAAELERLTGMACVFGKSIDFRGGEYGIAILTRGDILEHRHELHPVGTEAERRSYLLAKVRLRPSGRVVWIANTHLGLNSPDRRAQTRALLDAVRDLKDPVILVGDFNERPDEGDPPIHGDLALGFLDAWAEAEAAGVASFNPAGEPGAVAPNPFRGETFRADAPDRRIDYIWLRRGDSWRVRRAWVGATQASDHLPLFAALTLE